MAKTSERKKLTKKLDKAWRNHVCERDNYTCQWCGVPVEGSNAHASHIIPRSNGNRLRWDKRNGLCMCFHCHINKWHKDPVTAGGWFDIKYPEIKSYLFEEKAKGTVKFSISDLEELLFGF